MKCLIFVLFLTQVVFSRRHHHTHLHLNNAPQTGGHRDQHVGNHSQKMLAPDAEGAHSYNPYAKHSTGRHVCASHKTVTHPVKSVQTFCKPIYKKYTQRCSDNQLCTGVKLVYETAYRDVFSTKNTKQVDYACCPGWMQINRNSHGCNKPLCPGGCENGGTCTKPGLCSCRGGWRGRRCDQDVDECSETKPCDQICRNTPGHFQCDCRERFLLQEDGQSCKPEEDSPALEAPDLEHELLEKRLLRLETVLKEVQEGVAGKAYVQELTKKLDDLGEDVKGLKSRIHDFEIYHRDLKVIKNKISYLESRAAEHKKCPFNNRIC